MGVSNPTVRNGKYSGTLTEEECKKLDIILSEFNLNQPVEGLRNMAFDLTEEQVDTILEFPSYVVPFDQRSYMTLYDHQTVGAAFLYVAKSAILGDSVGLGKTLQVSAVYNLLALQHQQEGKPAPRMLYLSPNRPINNLRRELIRFTGVHFHYAPGTKEKLFDFVTEEGTDYPNVIMPHSVLLSPIFQSWVMNSDEFPYDLVVFDESSVLGSPSNLTTKQAKLLFKDCPRLLLLNATAFETNLDIFYHQLNLLDSKFLPTKKIFDKTYKNLRWNGLVMVDQGGYKNAENFKNLVSYRYLPRTRNDLGATFTNCTAERIEVPLTLEQKFLLKDTTLHRSVYDCPWTLDPDATTGKVRVLAGLVQRLTPQQVLIYAHFKEAQNAILEELLLQEVPAEILNGDTDKATSDRIIKDFQGGKLRVLITNVQTALNFGDVNHCIFYSYNPNPNKMVQFEGRITRSLHIADKHVYILLTEGKESDTFDTVIRDRALASEAFIGSDFSLILTLLKK